MIDAASGTPEDILTAPADDSPGDTIRIPAGTFDFEQSITIDAGFNITGACHV